MYKAQEQEQKHRARKQQAQARGEGIRAEIRALLQSNGPGSAPDLLPHMPKDVSLAEVAFQLERLVEEGDAVGERGGPYSLI